MCRTVQEGSYDEQQRHGISTGLASSQSSSRKPTQTPSREATRTRRLERVAVCRRMHVGSHVQAYAQHAPSAVRLSIILFHVLVYHH